MTTTDLLREEIVAELKRKVEPSETDLLSLVRNGDGDEALAQLVFFTPPAGFAALATRLREAIQQEFSSANAASLYGIESTHTTGRPAGETPPRA